MGGGGGGGGGGGLCIKLAINNGFQLGMCESVYISPILSLVFLCRQMGQAMYSDRVS